MKKEQKEILIRLLYLEIARLFQESYIKEMVLGQDIAPDEREAARKETNQLYDIIFELNGENE